MSQMNVNPFDEDSDDDEEEDDGESGRPKKKQKKEKATSNPFEGSLLYKQGKSTGKNSVLYYVDYKKLKNNGNGLEVDQRNEVTSKLAEAEAELASLTESVSCRSTD